MSRMIKIIVVALLSISMIAGSSMSIAKTSNIINFKDENLQKALNKYYNWNCTFTEEKANELSKKEYLALVIEDSEIVDLEGLQYFDNLVTIYLGGNKLENIKPLSEIDDLEMLIISNNLIKGKTFERMLSTMGRIENLDTLQLNNNRIANISFLENMGNIEKYYCIEMKDNQINDISILNNATNLTTIDLANNRITDVTPLKDLEKLTFCIDLRDNCIIDYKPIKHLFDKMYSDFDSENGMDRYDYYTNPVNFNYNGKKIEFPYLTVYYKYQAYAEAIPFFEALGGSAEYNKETGTFTCKYNGNELVMKDFSRKYTLNGEEKSLKYEMRRMQYDLAYIPVKDICNVLGLKYKVIKKRKFYQGNGEYKYAPQLVEISKDK